MPVVFFSAGTAEALYSAVFGADPQILYMSGPQCQKGVFPSR